MVKPEVLAIIPARGGSKGIPRKNLHPFLGYPLIAYSITAALQAETVTRTIVSTDSDEIASVAREYGAQVPFLRPIELAQDQTLDLPVFQHALNWLLENEGYQPDIIVQLRPTSPVRPRTCVDDAVKLLLAHPEASSVRGVVPSGQNPHKMWRIDPTDGHMLPLLSVEGIDEPYNSPRQVLPKTYWQTGHIDAIRPSTVLEGNSMSGSLILPLFIDDHYTVDIDNLFTLHQAEWVVQNNNLDIPFPGKRIRSMPKKIDLVVLDFDGVMTDNRVWVDQNGNEQIAANRSDSLGIRELRRQGVQVIVLSTETNPVVSARCRKLNMPVIQGVQDKATVLKKYLEDNGFDPQCVVYVGNDINDTPCFPIVGWAVAVEDAQTMALNQADYVLSRRGGYGAVREMCDLIISKIDR